MPNNRKAPLQANVRLNVESGANVYTDALASYEGLSSDYMHQVIDHAEAYVDGQIHTNGCESFWSLMKRGLKGTYAAVDPFHLFGIWTRRRSASTCGSRPMRRGSMMPCAVSWAVV